MTKPSITQSQKRFQESTGALFGGVTTKKCIFLKSSTDVGVIRNGGRNGARFAPQSFLATFKKFSQTESLKDFSFAEFEVSSHEAEMEDFHEAQKVEARKISLALNGEFSCVCHLGGGHDHIYPLLHAMSPEFEKVIVINIDAHADTRTDENFHSGTPFRQFANEFPGDFEIYQIGLHPFANSFSTLSELEKGTANILWKEDFDQDTLDALFETIQSSMTEKTLVVFSLDADALSGSEVPGVSAVNPAGFSRKELTLIWDRYAGLKKSHAPIIGIYELNPVYDTLASISMRTLASFVFETLR